MNNSFLVMSTLVCGAFFSQNTQAVEEKPALIVHLASVHSQSGFNNATVGIGYRFSSGFTVGVFHNSYSKFSTYGGWLWNIDENKHFGFFLGLATGYELDSGKKIVPLLIPSVRVYEASNTSVRINYFFDPRKSSAQVLHLSLDHKF
jgi:hypothetical protein